MLKVNLSNLKKQKRNFKRSAKKASLAIEDYRLMRSTIEVDYYVSEQQEYCSTTFVDRNAYEKWLSATGKLHWEIEDEEGDRYRHHEGEMQIDFYWDHCDYTDKVKHLKEFLDSRINLNPDHSFDITGCLS